MGKVQYSAFCQVDRFTVTPLLGENHFVFEVLYAFNNELGLAAPPRKFIISGS